MFGDLHQIPSARRFASHDEALEVDADGWVVATPDSHHHRPALAALTAGIPVLVEKPMAATIEDTVDLVATAERAGSMLMVGHVLRYTPFFTTLNDVISSGRLGEIVTVEHRENVVAWHMAHSYVRGNWASAAQATPMIVAKCCHDFDVLTWNMSGAMRSVTSIGSLLHFTSEHAPAGATARCTDPCPIEDCPFDARRIYLKEAWQGWPVHVITDDLSQEGRLRALAEGRYGRCVYTAGSDVVDPANRGDGTRQRSVGRAGHARPLSRGGQDDALRRDAGHLAGDVRAQPGDRGDRPRGRAHRAGVPRRLSRRTWWGGTQGSLPPSRMRCARGEHL